MACLRCGKCCLTHMLAYVTAADLASWRRENRNDILKVVENGPVTWAGDRIVSRDEGSFQGCPFLKWENRQYACTIYETRPNVCRDFCPGSSPLCPQWKD